jgi:hypothetical protein|tara:strand:- start:1280 stop:1441 length:162 start_codon:yes stop_codon:yes gene_type:complete
MINDLEWLKVFGVNGGVLATVSLTDFELILKVILLILTCVWSGIKIVKLIKEE